MIDIAQSNPITKEISQIVKLYKKFEKYECNTKEQLANHIEPSIKLKQYKVLKKNNEIVAFTSWAFMSEKAEAHYKVTGQMLYNFWNSGDRCWIVDSICHDDNFNAVYEWAKRYFTMQLGLNKPVSWLRVNSNYEIEKHTTKYTKEEYV